LINCNSCGVSGIDAYIVNIEADIIKALPSYDVVGLADTAIKESKERVRSGIKNSGFEFPAKKITINLAPAAIKKEGTHYDLPMAIALLGAMGKLKKENISNYIILGELSLSGDVRGVSGILPMADKAYEAGFVNIIVPDDNKKEAALVPNLNVYPVKTLKDAVEIINREKEVFPYINTDLVDFLEFDANLDFSDVKGQDSAKRALEIACAGGHSCLMVGSPGSGKTMLSKRVPGILPPLNFSEAMSVTKIYSVCSLVSKEKPLITKRPFRALHHTASTISVIGGGGKARPGEISLAHNGVLFLDELPEFKRESLEVLRQPLEDKYITVTRVNKSATYPCNFMIIASMNPCPCGYFGSQVKDCTCSIDQIKKYQKKISGPLLDRIDIQIEVPAVLYNEISSNEKAESTKDIRERILKAREIQKKRYENADISTNSELTTPLIKKYCNLSEDAQNLIKIAFDNLGLSARGYTKIIKVARTIADLENENDILPNHIAEAIQYRDLGDKYFK
jgi:magnesium chelatase family protein